MELPVKKDGDVLLKIPDTRAFCDASIFDLDAFVESTPLHHSQPHTCLTPPSRKLSAWAKVYYFLLICLITSAANGCGSGVVKAGAGVLHFTSEVVNFGDVSVGEAHNSDVGILNSGDAPVLISELNVAGNNFSTSSQRDPISIPAGGTHTLRLSFLPTSYSDFAGQLTLMSAAAEPMAMIGLRGRGGRAEVARLTASASSLGFGAVTVGSTSLQSLTLTATGASPVTINSATLSGSAFSLVGAQLPVTLSPGQAVTLQVQLKPAASGPLSDQLAITSNAMGGQTDIIALSGAGTAPVRRQLRLDPAILDFGSVKVGSAKTLAVTLTSLGTAPVMVNAAALSGPGYTLMGAVFPLTVSPSQAVTLQVVFAPTVAGGASAQLTISTDATRGSSIPIPLSGTGIPAPNPQLSLSLTQLSFGNVTLNSPATLPLILTSTGSSPVTVSAATISGAGYSLVGAALPLTLNPGQTATLQVRFTPTVAGGAGGQLILRSDASGGSSTTVALSGTGIAASNPHLSLSLTQLSFGNITINSPATLSLILTSTGSSPVTVNAASITGTGFTLVSSNLRVTLEPTQSLALQVQFDPQTLGTSTGSLTISSNSLSGNSTIVALTGTAITLNPILTASPASLTFGSIAVNTTSVLPLTLRSTGTTAVTVSSATLSGAGYALLSGTFPITLDPGQTATLQVQLKPGTSGDATGLLSLRSDSINGSTVTVALSGTGLTAGHQVDLTWDAAAASTNPVTGYNIYRSIGGSTPALLNKAPHASTSYSDTTVISTNSYNYIVKSVDASGSESVASNQIQLTIP
jgi:hypothetical protein